MKGIARESKRQREKTDRQRGRKTEVQSLRQRKEARKLTLNWW